MSARHRYIDKIALTPRELEIVPLLAQGYTNPQIAAVCGITRETVKSHVGNILNKLAIGSRHDVIGAIESGDNA